nr:MAG TPA: hypothetical protein [Caudoviricetes sp.]
MPPRQCCLRECFIISLAKALALQLPLLPRTIALDAPSPVLFA